MIKLIVLKVIPFFISFIECGYQIIDISLVFAGFEVIYNVNYVEPNNVVLPDVTYHVEFDSIIDYNSNESANFEKIMNTIKTFSKLSSRMWPLNHSLLINGEKLIEPRYYLNSTDFNEINRFSFKINFNLVVSHITFITVQTIPAVNYSFRDLIVEGIPGISSITWITGSRLKVNFGEYSYTRLVQNHES